MCFVFSREIWSWFWAAVKIDRAILSYLVSYDYTVRSDDVKVLKSRWNFVKTKTTTPCDNICTLLITFITFTSFISSKFQTLLSHTNSHITLGLPVANVEILFIKRHWKGKSQSLPICRHVSFAIKTKSVCVNNPQCCNTLLYWLYKWTDLSRRETQIQRPPLFQTTEMKHVLCITCFFLACRASRRCVLLKEDNDTAEFLERWFFIQLTKGEILDYNVHLVF